MKTFVSLSIDYDHPNETGVVIFQAKNKEDAVLAVAEDTLGETEINDFLENGEEGDTILDWVDIYILDEFPVMISEVKGLKVYETAVTQTFETWYSSDVANLLEEKYPQL